MDKCKKKTCNESKCDTSCEDNPPRKFGLRWCEVNAKDENQNFCKDDYYKNGCKKSCGVCE